MSKYDILISYAHLDNRPPLEGYQGWVTVLVKALQTELNSLLGREVGLWWDQSDLPGHEPISDVIKQGCDDSALLLAVVSPRYLSSESCQAEFSYFIGKQGASERANIFTVERNSLEAEDVDSTHPDLAKLLKETRGYAFYYLEETARRSRLLDPHDPELAPRFLRAVGGLAQDIAERLRQFKRESPSIPPAWTRERLQHDRKSRVNLKTQENEVVFVAAPASDTFSVHSALLNELAGRGIPVASPDVWSDEVQEAEAQLETHLRRAAVAVHFVGAAYGSLPEGADRSLPQRHFERLEELVEDSGRATPVARIVWQPPGEEAKSPRQRAFLERLGRHEWAQHDELLTGSLQQLVERIVAKRQTLARERERAEAEERTRLEEQAARQLRHVLDCPGAPNVEPESHSGVRRIYVISDLKDHEDVAHIETVLEETPWEVLSAVEVTEDNLKEPEEKREQQHQEYLEKSHAFLIYHGHAKFRWVRAQAEEARKAFVKRGMHDAPTAVYISKPIEGRRATYQLHGLERLIEVEEDARANLAPLLQRLEAYLVGRELAS